MFYVKLREGIYGTHEVAEVKVFDLIATEKWQLSGDGPRTLRKSGSQRRMGLLAVFFGNFTKRDCTILLSIYSYRDIQWYYYNHYYLLH